MSASFYDSGLGDRLVDTARYPPEISQFLQAERQAADALAPTFKTLVEVGCMEGRYLDWAVQNGKRYVGFDVVPRYIARGRERLLQSGLSDERFDLRVASAEEAAEAVRRHPFGLQPRECLFLFPFNSFGNMADPSRVLSQLAEAGGHAAISSYSTSEYATECRQSYYEACGYAGIVRECDGQGVRFRSADGLDTVAYQPEYLAEISKACGLPLRLVSLSPINAFYVTGEQHHRLLCRLMLR